MKNFVIYMKKNKIIKFKEKYIQKYFIENVIFKNKDINNATIIKNFYDITKEKLILSKSEISKIHTKIIGEYKNLTSEQVINKIKEAIPDLYIKIQDIIYEKKSKIKQKEESRD